MSLISLIVVLIVVGVLLWALQSMPYIEPGVKQIIRILVIVACVLWVLSVFVGIPSFGEMRLH